MTGFPEVSVIIPAYHAQDTIRRALDVVSTAGIPLSDVEIVISPDDGEDYAPFVPSDMRLTQASIGPIATGVGAARNRAVQASSGRFVAFLDADDSWEPGYLASSLPIARRDGLVFTPTRVMRDGTEILRTLGGPDMTLSDLARTGASHHPVLARELVGTFRGGPSQDVLHAVELLAARAGRVAASKRAYELHLRDGSVSRSHGFPARVARAYRDMISDIEAGRTRVPVNMRKSASDVFRQKLKLNQDFERSGAVGFYEYMADRLREMA